eukprot:6743390-Prymnesium_polylepis.1
MRVARGRSCSDRRAQPAHAQGRLRASQLNLSSEVNVCIAVCWNQARFIRQRRGSGRGGGGRQAERTLLARSSRRRQAHVHGGVVSESDPGFRA